MRNLIVAIIAMIVIPAILLTHIAVEYHKSSVVVKKNIETMRNNLK